MGKMIRGEGNVVRPRRSNVWAPDSLKPKKNGIFKIGENEFAVNLPQPGLTYNKPYLGQSPLQPELKSTQPKEKQSELKKSLLGQLENYCEKTTLHGLRYVGDSNLSFGERIFWFISFSLAIGFAAYYITNIYTKWKSSPVIISFSPFDADLSSIPFPAITICNMNQAKKSEALRILKEGSNTEKKLLDDSCNGNATFENKENIKWETLRDFLVRVGNSCSDMLKSCQWGNDVVNCDDFFNNEYTDEGLCCSFNRLPPEKIFRNSRDISILNQTYPSNVYDWNPEIGFTTVDQGDSVPRRPLGAGAHLGLTVILDAQIDNYYCSSTSSTGFKVILANPIETPKMADFGFLISPGFETRISIEPSVREATDSLRSVSIDKRQCYFSNERPLQYYRKYTLRNCRVECEAVSAFLKCNCFPYYLPVNNSLKHCDQNSHCVQKLKDMINKRDGIKKFIKGKSVDCQCKSNCFSVKFGYEKSDSPLRRLKLKTNMTLRKEMQNFASITFFFDKTQYSKILKRPLYIFSDLLANTGGLLGLFVGFSLLSVVEAMFFLTYLTSKSYLEINKKQQPLYEQKPEKLTLKPVSSYPSYTQMNCLNECQSNFTLRDCQCIPYYLPQNANTKVCSIADDECVNRVEKETADLKDGSFLDNECFCIPGCSEIEFEYQMSRGPLEPKRVSVFSNKSVHYFVTKHPRLKLGSLSVLTFYFPDEKFNTQIKDFLYGFSEILSNVGGILSLCLGVSFLSVVEALYYVSLRIFCSQIREKRQKKRRRVKFHQGIKISSLTTMKY